VIASILGFIKIVVSLATWLAAGAVAALAGRVLPVVPAMVVGAVFVAGTAYWVNPASKDALKAQNRALMAKRDELVLTTRELEKTLSTLLRASEDNEKIVEDLRDQLANMEDRPECIIDKGIVDELNKIR